MSATGITFYPLPITGITACGIPVLPGTPEADAPLKDRTELCACDANWIVGSVPTCDHHVREICELTDIDWTGLVEEAGRELQDAQRPWGDRKRHSQTDAREHLAVFTGDPSPSAP